jgi:hypothetical protein
MAIWGKPDRSKNLPVSEYIVSPGSGVGKNGNLLWPCSDVIVRPVYFLIIEHLANVVTVFFIAGQVVQHFFRGFT